MRDHHQGKRWVRKTPLSYLKIHGTFHWSSLYRLKKKNRRFKVLSFSCFIPIASHIHRVSHFLGFFLLLDFPSPNIFMEKETHNKRGLSIYLNNVVLRYPHKKKKDFSIFFSMGNNFNVYRWLAFCVLTRFRDCWSRFMFHIYVPASTQITFSALKIIIIILISKKEIRADFSDNGY